MVKLTGRAKNRWVSMGDISKHVPFKLFQLRNSPMSRLYV